MMLAAALAAAAPTLRNAAGEPPLGIGGLAFRDDHGEVFRPQASYAGAGWIGVLELETGAWLAQPPGFRIDAETFVSREAALRTAIARKVRQSRRFMRADPEGAGTHWTQGYGGRVIEWALSLKEDKGRPIQVASADAEADRDHPVSATVTAKYKISVQFSGGAASYVAAKLILDEFGHDGVALIFADTLIEDEDLYRFLDDAERHLQHPIIRISEGRDPWTVFFDERMMGNSRVDPCSKILKRKLLDKWRVENCSSDCTLVIGYDASEDFRFQPLKSRMLPVKVRAPLLEQGVWKEQAYAMVEADGLRLPRLYGMGFSHNNCGGFCVKAGQGSFALLLENLPERYAQHEAKEEEFRKFIGKDVSIMRDRRGGVSKPLTMREFRERHEREPMLVDRSDVGGCLCMEEPPENPSEEINPAANVANGLAAESPTEEITPQFTSWRYDRDDAVQLNSDPIVAQLLDAHRLRQQFPAKHAVSMTTAMVNGEFRNVGTCACGVVMSHTHPDRLDAAIEAHWRRFVHEKDTVDGRGQLIKPGDASRIPSAKPKRKRKSSDGGGESRPAPEGTVSVAASGLRERRPRDMEAAGSQREAETGRSPEMARVREQASNCISQDSDRIAGPPAARDRAGVAPGPSDSEPAAGGPPAAIASAPSANDTPGADASISRAPEPAPIGAALSDDDWLLKAAAELAWREPPKLTEVQAALLDFGKVYAPGRKVERPILRWHGGKWKLAPWIISHFPPHKVYIEPFGGAGSVLLQKLPAITEVWNDLEGEVVNLFSVLRNAPDDLARLIYLTPFSRQEYHALYEMVEDPVERARQFVARSFMGQSSKGALRKSGFDSRVNPDGFASRLNSLRAMPEEFYAIAERFRNIVIEQRPAEAIFAQYDRQDVLFYVDPPYLSDRAKHYTHELDEAGHTALLETLRSLAGMVVLSGYRSELYDAALTDWRRVEIEAHADGGIDRTEVLWLNPACAAALDEKHPTLFNIAAADVANAPPPHGLSGD